VGWYRNLNSPTSAYGGNEEIVLQGGKEQRKAKSWEETETVAEPKNVYAQRSSNSLPEYRLPTEAEWNMQLQQMWDKENIAMGQKKYPWSGGYTFRQKTKSKSQLFKQRKW
jgi:hypothetical protein